MAEYPSVRARLLVGDERISANPKLNNVFKGWHAAEHDRIVLSDSNVLLPRDYLERVLAAWKPDTGLVSAPPVGGKAAGFWANLECAFLNTYQARWQYAADTIGMGFAQGKTLACRRSLIEAHGGIRALGAEAAEDAAATKLVRAAGRRVRLVDAPFEQPLGRRELAGVWSRQVRWARLRRDSFPAIYALEALAGAAVPGALLAFVVCNTDLPVASIVGLFLGSWYGAEMVLAAAAGWHLPLAYPVYAMLRDAMLPVLFVEGWRDRGFEWRGNAMSIDEREGAEAA
jgi:ceramide glucosyltransferase